jgi:hypothetical protein
MSKSSQIFCLSKIWFRLDNIQSFGIKIFSYNSQDVHSYWKDPHMLISKYGDFSHSCELLLCHSTYLCAPNDILDKIFNYCLSNGRIQVWNHEIYMQ